MCLCRFELCTCFSRLSNFLQCRNFETYRSPERLTVSVHLVYTLLRFTHKDISQGLRILHEMCAGTFVPVAGVSIPTWTNEYLNQSLLGFMMRMQFKKACLHGLFRSYDIFSLQSKLSTTSSNPARSVPMHASHTEHQQQKNTPEGVLFCWMLRWQEFLPRLIFWRKLSGHRLTVAKQHVPSFESWRNVRRHISPPPQMKNPQEGDFSFAPVAGFFLTEQYGLSIFYFLPVIKYQATLSNPDETVSQTVSPTGL